MPSLRRAKSENSEDYLFNSYIILYYTTCLIVALYCLACEADINDVFSHVILKTKLRGVL